MEIDLFKIEYLGTVHYFRSSILLSGDVDKSCMWFHLTLHFAAAKSPKIIKVALRVSVIWYKLLDSLPGDSISHKISYHKTSQNLKNTTSVVRIV